MHDIRYHASKTDCHCFAWLVVSTIFKNMKVNGKDDIPYMKWTIKFMFETNQPFIIHSLSSPLSLKDILIISQPVPNLPFFSIDFRHPAARPTPAAPLAALPVDSTWRRQRWAWRHSGLGGAEGWRGSWGHGRWWLLNGCWRVVLYTLWLFNIAMGN